MAYWVVTNSHDISVQLIMRRCIDSHNFAIHNWPVEFKDEFFPLVEKYNDNHKGSLKESSLEVILCSPLHTELVQGLPPVHECAFEQHIKDGVCRCISKLLSIEVSQFHLLTLYKKYSAIKIGKFILGSCSSRHITASLVKAKLDATDDNAYDRLAEI